MGWKIEAGEGSFKETKGELVCQECSGNEGSKEVIQGEAVPEPWSGLGTSTDIPNICAFARQRKENLPPCLEA